MGCAYEGLGDKENAELYFRKATVGSAEPAIAFFYNDQQPDKIYYQGLAWRKLGDEKKARSRFNKLINHGEQHLFDHVKIDYFCCFSTRFVDLGGRSQSAQPDTL